LSENQISIKRGDDVILLRQILSHLKRKIKRETRGEKKEKGLKKEKRKFELVETKLNVNTSIMM